MVKLFNNYEDELSLQEETRIKKAKKRNQQEEGRPAYCACARFTNHFDVCFFFVSQVGVDWRTLLVTGGPDWWTLLVTGGGAAQETRPHPDRDICILMLLL